MGHCCWLLMMLLLLLLGRTSRQRVEARDAMRMVCTDFKLCSCVTHCESQQEDVSVSQEGDCKYWERGEQDGEVMGDRTC